MLFVTLVAFAQSLSVDRVSVSPGGTATVTVNISGATQSIAAGMCIELPQGFTFVFDEEKNAYIVGGDVWSKSHSGAENLQQENVLKFAITSSKNAAFKKDSGILFSFTVACGDNVGSGTYSGLLKTIEISTVDSQLKKIDNVTFSFTVNGGTTPTPSDTTKVDPTPVDPTSIDPTPEVITSPTHSVFVPNIAAKAGEQSTATINIKDATQYIATDMYVCLPEGFTFVYNVEEEAYCAGGEVFSKSHYVNDSIQDPNILKLNVASVKKASFKSDNGSLVTCQIACDANVANGTYLGELKAITFEDAEGTVKKESNVTFIITVGAETQPVDPTPVVPTPTDTIPVSEPSVSVPDVALKAGTQSVATVNITGATKFAAAGMFIELPAGMTFAAYEDAVYADYCADGDVLAKIHNISDNLHDSNLLKLAITCVKNMSFAVSEGSLLSFTIACDASVAPGTYYGKLRAIEFSKADKSGLYEMDDVLFSITVAAADPGTPDIPSEHVVSVADLAMDAGEQTTAAINIKGASDYIAAGMYVSLPEGFSFAADPEEGCYILEGDVLGRSHSIADKLRKDNLVKFIVITVANEKFSKSEGTLASFRIVCDSTLSSGSYTGVIRGVQLSSADSPLYEEDNITFTINVTNKNKFYTPATVMANSFTRIYGDENPSFTYSELGGDVDGKPVIRCEATKASPVGTYPIVVEKGNMSNDKVTMVDGVLTILPAQLYISAGEYLMFEGNEVPEQKTRYHGFRNNEGEAVLTSKPTLTTTATADSKPGTYPVAVSGAAAQNYDINYIDGSVTVYSIGDLDGDGKFSVDDVMQFIDMYLLNDSLF